MTDPDQRLQRVIAALVRQEFGAPITTVIGLTEIMIEDARRGGDDALVSDLNRIHSAGLSLQGQLGNLVTLATQTALNEGADLAELKTKLGHDLRTPLNAIKGYSELIIEDARDAGRAELLADVAKVLAAAEQLLGQIDKVLGLTGASEASAPNAPSFARMPSPDQIGQIMRSIEPAMPKPREEPSSGRILVVDDTEANRELLSRRLTRNGHLVDTANGGQAALEAITGTAFDLILLDLMMPDMNGLEVLTRLKEDVAVRHIPVIMISALDEIDGIVRCIEAGAEDYIPKPFDPVLLGARIEASLERKRLRDREQAFTKALTVEKGKTETLLLSILPEPILRRIRQGETAIADRFPEATILFSDLVGFTNLATSSSIP